MARIAGVTLPPHKRIDIGLSAIYGVGRPRSAIIIAATQVNPATRVKDLTDEEVARLREYIEKQYKVEGDLKREIMLNIKRLKEIGSWRGMRHTRGLPVRGQRTKTNSRTVRGNVRRTMGSGKKPTSQKT